MTNRKRARSSWSASVEPLPPRGVVAAVSSAIVLGMLLVSCTCGAPASSPESARTSDSSELASSWSGPALSDGACGGLRALDLGDARPVLADRFRVRWPRIARDDPAPYDVMSAPPNPAHTEVETIADGDARLRVYVEETFRTRGGDLHAAVASVVPDGWRVDAPRADTRVVTAGPSTLTAEDGGVLLLAAWVADDDGRVGRLSFYVDEASARTGGCVAVARAIARTAIPGSRRLLPATPGTHVLFGRLAIDVPEGHHVHIDDGPDFSVYRIEAETVLGAPSSELGIYRGGHPSFSAPDRPPTRETTTLGTRVSWYESEEHGETQGNAVIPDRGLHVFYGSGAALLAGTRAMAESLHEVDAPEASPTCTRRALPVEVRDAPPTHGDEIDLLAGATRFAMESVTLGEPVVPEVRAFRTILAGPDAFASFAQLVRSGRPAGRLYGAAGLAALRPELAEAVACWLREEIEGTVITVDACGTSERDARAILVADGAPRGEPYWTQGAWGLALGSHTVRDVAGGSIAWLLAHDDRSGARGVWSSLVGQLRASDLEGLSLEGIAPPGPEAIGALRIYSREVDGGGFCAERHDGRVACFGASHGDERVELLPDLVRHPLGIVFAIDRTCWLDGERQRVCSDTPPAFGWYARACGHPRAAGRRDTRYADGPWRAFADDVPCAIREDGALYCFDPSPPRWAEHGEHGAYRVPIEGEVVGVTHARSARWAWTSDGRIVSFGDDSPAEVASVEGLARIAGGTSSAVFAETRDGRVFARGLVNEREYWLTHGGARLERWIELTDLHGAHVSASDTHACALFEDHRVRCWGDGRHSETGLASGSSEEAPHDVPELHGAQALYLQQQLTCARMDDDTLRCIGLGDVDASIDTAESLRGPHDIRVPRD